MIWNRYMRAAHAGLPIERFPAAPPPVTIIVPDVRGKTFDEAKAMLEAAGFSVRQKTVASSLAPGVVAGQNPHAGTEVETGAMITLAVSDGSLSGGPPTPEPEPTEPEPTPEPT